MSELVTEVYEAFVEAGASKETATKAAATLAQDFIRRDQTPELATKADIAIVEAKLEMLQWMVGAGFGVTVLVIVLDRLLG